MPGHVLQRQLFGVVVKHLARDQRPQWMFAQHQRHGEMHQPRSVALHDKAASGQGVGNAVTGRKRRQGEGTPHPPCRPFRRGGNRRGLGVQETPRRSGVDDRPELATGRIGEGHREVRATGVLCQPVLPERRVQEVGMDGRLQFDAERLRRGLANVLVAVVLQHPMLREGHGFLSVLQRKESSVTWLRGGRPPLRRAANRG